MAAAGPNSISHIDWLGRSGVRLEEAGRQTDCQPIGTVGLDAT